MPIESAHRSIAVTPDDTAQARLPGGVCEGLWIGVGGTLNYVPYTPHLATDDTAIATTVPAGLFPVRVKRVNATGTAAAQIVALY